MTSLPQLKKAIDGLPGGPFKTALVNLWEKHCGGGVAQPLDGGGGGDGPPPKD